MPRGSSKTAMARRSMRFAKERGLRGDLEAVKLPSGYYKAFVELHIEQGPLLEATAESRWEL